MINYWVQKGSFGIYNTTKDKVPCGKVAVGYMVLCPIFVVYLVLMDALFLINTAVLVPLVHIVNIITCGKVDGTKLTTVVDSLYSILFDMSLMEIEGFRRLRTIS